MKLNTRQTRQVPGWVGGIQEDAEPASGFDRYGNPIGIVDDATNVIPTEVGRLAVRGGSRTALVFTDGAAHSMSSMLSVFPFSPIGACAVGHYAAGSKHYLQMCASDFSSLILRVDLAWNIATPAINVIGRELWEKIYVVDGNTNFGTRQQLKAVSAAGAVTAIVADFGSGSEAVKPYCIEVFNGNLFIAGQDNGGNDDAPAMVRHALLGTDPASGTAGWSPTAYNIIGAKGVRVTAMKAGDQYMLIAKQNELYRLSGFGRGLDGWQYTVQPLDNTLGVGVFNPRALAYSRGYWYGVGAAGPFRTDGESVDMMVGPRRRSWPLVSNLDQAWVVNHPDRQHILFGFVTQGASAPMTIWCWDESREVWSATWTTTTPLAYAAPIAATAYAGPTGVAPSLAMTHTSSTLTSVTGVLTAGDGTASSEIWIDKGAGYVLDQTLAPGVTAFTINSLSSSTSYPIQARHTKAGVTGPYSASVTGYALLQPPTVTAEYVSSTSGAGHVTTSKSGMGRTVKFDGGTIQTLSSAGVGTTNFSRSGLAANSFHTFLAFHTSTTWPAAINQSSSQSASFTTPAGGGGL